MITMTKHRVIKSLLVGVLFIIGAVVIIIHLYWLDGIVGAFCETMFGETIYSDEYREFKFRRIRKGMSEEQVIKLVGKPLFTGIYNPHTWFYSYGKIFDKETHETNNDYTERIITFKDGIVIEIYHDFYFD